MSQLIASRRRFAKSTKPKEDEATTSQAALEEFEQAWAQGTNRILKMVPGKQALSSLNKQLQASYGVNVTASGVIDATHKEEIPTEMNKLLITSLSSHRN